MSEQPSAALPKAVFVDPSGRRQRWSHWVAVGAGLACGGYLLLVGAALVAPPGVLPLDVPGLGPLLPGPGAPKIITGAAGSGTPRQLLLPSARPTPTPAPTPTTGFPSARPPLSVPVRTVATPRPVGTPAALPPTASPVPSASARPTAPPATASPSATPFVRPTGRPTARPSHSPNPHSRALP